MRLYLLALIPGLAFAQQSLITMTPCRVIDTTFLTGAFGPPNLVAGGTRVFPVQSGSCNIPATATAYLLNITVVPTTSTLQFLTVWNTGVPQPPTSTLNSTAGQTVANLAVVTAGTNGSISVFSTDPARFIVDVLGYCIPATGGSGTQGPQGIPGPQGAIGPQGLTGADGASLPPKFGTGISIIQDTDANGNPLATYTVSIDALVVPSWVAPPVTSADHCSSNQFSTDKSYYYFCGSDGVWGRIPAQRSW